MNLQSYWSKLKKTGWLDHIPSTQHSEIKAQLARNLAECPIEAHVALAQGVIEAGESSPAAILQALSAATGGHFRPCEIHEKRDAKNIRLSFRVDQTDFVRDMSEDAVVIVTETVELANQSLSQSGRAERFVLLDDRYGLLILFVPPNVVQRARSAKLIPGRKTAVEFAIGSESQARSLTVVVKNTSRPKLKRFVYEHLTLDELRALLEILCHEITAPLSEILCTRHGAVVMRAAPEAVARLLALKKSELNQAVRDWLKTPAMHDSPFTENAAYCTDRLADVIGFLKANAKPKDSVLISVRPD